MSMELAELETQARAMAQRIPTITIVDAGSFAVAVEDRREIKRRLARIGELMDPICQATDQAHKTAVAQREGLRAPFLMADKAYSRAMGAYEQEQNRLRREAEEAARRERERLEAEERTRVEADRQRLEAKAIEQRETEIAAAAAKGDVAATLSLVEAPIETPVVAARPIVAPQPVWVPPAEARGVSFRDNWSAEIMDFGLLVQAVAAGQADLQLLSPNMPALNRLARKDKERLSLPGVRAVNERIAAQKTPGPRGVFDEET